jgi:predicted Zn-dependent peptidase
LEFSLRNCSSLHIKLYSSGLIISGSTNRSCISIKILGNKSKVKLNLLNILESIARPQFTYSQLLKERPIIIEEIKNYRINKIQNFANKARNQMFYKNMQEYDIVLGSISDVESIDLRDLFDFALHNLVSENIRCLIAGDDLNFFETQIRNYNFEQGSVCKSNVPKKTNSNSLCFDKIVRIRNNGRQNIARISYIKPITYNNLDAQKVISGTV